MATTEDNHIDFRREIVGERIVLMLPFNVVLVGRVRGTVNPSEVATALEQLRLRHPLLAVRAQIEHDGAGVFLGQGVPPIKLHVDPCRSEERWLAYVEEELRTSFPIETGPLVRCTLIHSERVCEILLCAHHAICDGMSLGYLLRDLLECLAKPMREFAGSIIPPLIDRSTVPTPPSANAIQQLIMGIINKRWAARDIRFTESDRRRMHEEFWRRNTGMQVLAWSMKADDTASLVERSRTEKVTVNSALWTAFLAAQYDIQVDRL